MNVVHETTADDGAMAGAEPERTIEGDDPPAERWPASSIAIAAALAAAWLLQVTIKIAFAVVCLALVLGGVHLTVGPFGSGGESSEPLSAGDGPGARTDGPAVPGSDPRDGNDDSAHRDDPDELWTLDGFADFGDAHLSVTGGPGGGWTPTRLRGHAVWVDDRCRLVADVVDPGGVGAGGVDTSSGVLSDAASSERLARSVGEVMFGSVRTLSDPVPAVIRLPLSGGEGAVELASVTLVPEEPRAHEASFLVVSARASAGSKGAVVFAIACVDTPVSRADGMARDLVDRFRLETLA
jgi:hypothetical protein